jgi:hypothetical protein
MQGHGEELVRNFSAVNYNGATSGEITAIFDTGLPL